MSAAGGGDGAWRTCSLDRLLFRATSLFSGEKLRIVHAGGFAAMSEAQMALVQNLDLHGTRLTVIAARAGMTKQSMLELVDRAEAQGFVERRTDPEDRRAKTVTFTPVGLAMLEQVREGVAVAERRMAGIMGAAFVATMRQQLAAYVAAAGKGELRMSDCNDSWRTSSVSRVLLSASATFARDVLRVMHEAGFDAVAEAHLTLFRNLDLDGTRLTEIASRARMTKQAMAELVDKAEALGFVVRQPDPGDRRAKTVFLTRAGLRLLDEQRKAVEATERRMAALSGDAFAAELRAQLTAYVASVDRPHIEARRLAVHGGHR